MTAVEWLHRFDPDSSRQEIHGLLGQMLFSGEEGLKPTDALSGGETARLLFCRLMLLKPNVLILDEPTNHLDLEAINALNIALQKYEGTVLLVTHDEDLLEEVGTRVWQFDRAADRRLQGYLRRADRIACVTAARGPRQRRFVAFGVIRTAFSEVSFEQRTETPIPKETVARSTATTANLDGSESRITNNHQSRIRRKQ